MSDRIRKERLVETQDEHMQSTESSETSLSFEHIDAGLLRSSTNTDTTRQTNTIDKLDMNFLDKFLIAGTYEAPQEPCLEIIEQPKPKDLRFRYECEGRSAGSLLGEKSSSERKTFPTVKVSNYIGRVKIVASLVTRQKPHQAHPNSLVGKVCKNGICTITDDNTPRSTFSFPNLGIQCAKKKDIQTALQERRNLGVNPFNQSAADVYSNNDFEMNVVCLCFQAFLPDPQQPSLFNRPLPVQVSVPIYDKKGASLNISRVDRNNGIVTGGDELFILCDKVQRDDIEVIFYHEDWEAKAIFGPSDIHRQVAIVCRTPAYKDKKIQRSVTVQFKLRRKSDKETSDPVEFTYTPIDTDADGVEAKRRKRSPQFENYFKANSTIKQEPVEPVQPCGSMQMPPQQRQQQQQQQQQLAAAAAASGDSNVKQVIRRKLQQGKHSSVKVIGQPPNNVRSTPGIATYSQESSMFHFSHGSNMTFGTMTQRDSPAATATSESPFASPQAPASDNIVQMAFQASSVEAVGHSSGHQPHAATAAANFGNGTASQSYGINTPNTDFTSLNADMIQLINSNVGDILNDESFTSLLTDENMRLDDLHTPSMDELITLENFDPRTHAIQDMSDGMASGDQGMADFTLESVNDSVSIPYCISVELEDEPQNNPNSNSNG